MVFDLETCIQFLSDENLIPPFHIGNRGDNWQININEPWTNDSKMRCGITLTTIRDKRQVYFNCFKATASIDDIYKGSFEKFLCLLKGFESYTEARMWFLQNYMFDSLDTLQDNWSRPFKEDEILPHEVVIQPDWELLQDKPEHKAYIKYLKNRCISFDDIKHLRLWISPYTKRIIFPTFEDGKVIFTSGRCIKENPVPWAHSKNIHTFPVWGLDKATDHCNIFEAIIDALMVKNGIATLGTQKIKQEKLWKKILDKNFKQINIIMDNDVAGIKAKIELANILSTYHNNVCIYNFYGLKEGLDFNKMKQLDIPFELEKRLLPWNLSTQTQLKLGFVR